MTQLVDHRTDPTAAAVGEVRAGREHLARQVGDAIRLGWYLAETRGRYWWRAQLAQRHSLAADPDRPLPLRPQRSVAESRHQAFGTLAYLAVCLEVDTDDQPGAVAFTDRLAALVARLDADDGALLMPPGTGSVPEQQREQGWLPVAELMYRWDCAIQDRLTARADILACAYLLGRGLAETYWSLPLDAAHGDQADPAAETWSFVLQPERRRELSRMAGRVGAYLPALTPVAVSGSLEAWGCVAADAAWCGRQDAGEALYEQSRIWYQLVVLGQDPTTLVHATTILRGRNATWRTVRAFLPQLALGALSVVLVALFVVLMSVDSGSPLLKSVLAVLGAIGLSASTLTAKAKSASQSLLARLRQSAHSDLVAIAASYVPPHPDDNRNPQIAATSQARRRVERAVQARSIVAPAFSG